MAFPDDILTAIRSVCQPCRVILYGEKRTLATDKLKAASFCVIVRDGADRQSLLTRLYLAVPAELPVHLTVYTQSEWRELTADPTSYAAWISRKGRVLYEQGA